MKNSLTFGERCSDYFAKKFASWRFVVPFLTAVGLWAFLNGCHYINIDKELAFVNFFISFVTLFIDLVIIMNQIRQNNTDREKLAAILSLEKNTIKSLHKHEESLNMLHQKIDQLLARPANEPVRKGR